MSKAYLVLLVLTFSFVTGVMGDPPEGPDSTLDHPENAVGGPCKRNEFLEKDKITDYLQQLKPGMDMQSVLDTLGNAVTEAIELCSPKYPPFDDFEVKSGLSYVCGSHGQVNNYNLLCANSWKYLGDKAPDKNYNGPLEFKMTFKYFGGVSIKYFNTYVQLPMAHDIKGTLFVKVKKARVDLTVSTDSFATLLDKLKQQKCFLHIKSLEVALTGVDHVMALVDHQGSYDRNRIRISSMLKEKVKEMKEGLKVKAKAVVYEGLVNSGEWVCLDDEVKELIKKKLTSTRKTISSENFNKYCRK